MIRSGFSLPPFTQRAARCLRRGADGELWQPRFLDRALRTVKEYNEEVEYIHLNPVGAGLVSRPEDWSRPAGSSYKEYAGMSADESVSRRTV
jgi:hypothetical protein